MILQRVITKDNKYTLRFCRFWDTLIIELFDYPWYSSRTPFQQRDLPMIKSWLHPLEWRSFQQILCGKDETNRIYFEEDLNKFYIIIQYSGLPLLFIGTSDYSNFNYILLTDIDWNIIRQNISLIKSFKLQKQVLSLL